MTTEDHELWDRLRATWRAGRLTVRPGASVAEVEDFERTHGVLLPSDVRDYFLAVDGMEDEMDHSLNRFWPLAMLKPVSHVLDGNDANRLLYPDYFVFLDHSISAFLWCVRVSRQQHQPRPATGEVYLLERSAAPPVAESFQRFMRMYLDDPESILR